MQARLHSLFLSQSPSLLRQKNHNKETMLRVIPLLLIFPLALLPSLILAAPPSLPPPPVFGSASAVTMTAFLDKSVYQTGQPIVLEVDLHNPEKQMVSIGGGAFEDSSFMLTITDASGRIMPRTPLGQRILAPPSAVYWNPVVAIRPQETRRYHINLTALFGVARAGSYTVRVSRTFELSLSQEFTLTAGPLKFQIIKVAASRNAPPMPFVHDPAADLNVP